jgi:negative regulator of flagellin synthesis FlgM
MANEIAGLRQTALTPTQAGPVAKGQVGAASQQSQQAVVPAADSVTLTDSARLLQRLEAAVAQAPHVDGQRIDQIKQQIASGAYQVDPQKLAEQFSQLESDLSSTHQLEGTRTDNGYTYSVSTTTARGTRERSVTVGYDADTGTFSRDVTVTGADGQQASRHGEVQRTDDGYTKSLTVTTPDGQSVSRQLDVSYDADNNSLSRVVTVDGQHHYTRSTQIGRMESGQLVHKTVVHHNENDVA